MCGIACQNHRIIIALTCFFLVVLSSSSTWKARGSKLDWHREHQNGPTARKQIGILQHNFLTCVAINTMLESEMVVALPTVSVDACWEVMTAWSILTHFVFRWCFLLSTSAVSIWHFSFCNIPFILWLTRFKSAEYRGHNCFVAICRFWCCGIMIVVNISFCKVMKLHWLNEADISCIASFAH